MTLIILNTPIPPIRPIFDHLWSVSLLKIAADGGSNRLHEMCPTSPLIPDLIIGDLDSITPMVKSFYESSTQTKLIKNPDQDSNDLEKCLEHVLSSSSSSSSSPLVVVYGAFGGRFDQSMQSINALYKFADRFERLLLINEETSATLLLPDRQNVIRPNRAVEGPICGLIPVGFRSTVTTTGLKWNLTDSELVFGGMVSSSNEFIKDEVTVVTTSPIVWTSEIRQKLV